MDVTIDRFGKILNFQAIESPDFEELYNTASVAHKIAQKTKNKAEEIKYLKEGRRILSFFSNNWLKSLKFASIYSENNVNQTNFKRFDIIDWLYFSENFVMFSSF